MWSPTEAQIDSANLTRFMQWLNREYGYSFGDYDALYHWSITETASFWESFWHYASIICSRKYDSVLTGDKMFDAKWFGGARLNFAENLLSFRDERTAIVHRRENLTGVIKYTFRELFDQVQRAVAAMKALGVVRGDRVAAFIPNIPEAVIGMLAATSIGAIWSSCSPDFGIQSVFDRFGQIKPKLLITADGYRYNGKQHDSLLKVRQLCERIDSIEMTVVVNILGSDLPDKDSWTSWGQFLESAPEEPLDFEQLPFDHPVYIMYSSGTTGVPKCIVHGAGGTLLQHAKEHRLHTNLTRNDLLFYFTTTGWMMWNWLIGSLSTGNAIYLYDGSPGHPDLSVLFEAIQEDGITVFGTSPKFLSSCENASLAPGHDFDLKSLRAILSTGAPLSERNFEYVYSSIKNDLQLASISGGTDIISCFMLGNPLLPVRSGEIQGRGLGMRVEAFSDTGEPVVNQVGELVCTAPFPSMPIGFWNDPDRQKYYRAYFDHFDGIWRHGDFIKINDHGGVVVYGRSDSTLNPGGIRIGTAEIYAPVEAIAEIVDSIVVSHRIDNDVEIILFVVTADSIELDSPLEMKIRTAIRSQATPRHLPSRIIRVPQIPHTINGKKVEVAVSRIIHGQDVPNRDALANPESLDAIREAWEKVTA